MGGTRNDSERERSQPLLLSMGTSKPGGALVGNPTPSANQPQPITDHEDVFPHLDTLVSAHLSAVGVVSEAFRILVQHYRTFLYPVLFFTVWSFYAFWLSLRIPRWSGRWDSETVLSASWLPQYRPSEWFWVFNLGYFVFSGITEAVFHRAAVRVLLRENYGDSGTKSAITDDDDGGHDDRTRQLITSGLRSVSALFANLIAFSVLSFAIGGFEYLVFSFLDSDGHHGLDRSLWLVIAGIVFYVLVLSVFFSLFVVSLPSAALTRLSGFQTLQQSALLTRGDRLAAFGLFLTALLLTLAAFIPVVIIQRNTKDVPTVVLVLVGIWIWLLTIVWFPVRTVLYLKYRALDKISAHVCRPVV